MEFNSDSPDYLSASRFLRIVEGKEAFALSPFQLKRASQSFGALQSRSLSDSQDILYGINTGFGPHAFLSLEEKIQNQYDLVSHLTVIPQSSSFTSHREGRAVLLARLQVLGLGASSVSLELLSILGKLLSSDTIPVLPKRGSLSASGDLIPLAAIALALQGDGQWSGNLEEKPEPYSWKPKEALAMTNGTSFTTALALLTALDGERLLEQIFMLLEYFFSFHPVFPSSFSPELWKLKSNAYSRSLSNRLFPFVSKNPKKKEEIKPIQDQYSIRCIPAILGAVQKEWKECIKVFEQELNSVSDNPVWTNEGGFLEGGLFYAGEVSFAIDRWNTAAVSLGNWLERLFQYLTLPEMNGTYPLMLSPKPGRFAGFSGLGLLATHTLAEMRRNAMPASIQSLTTNGNNQDIVPMGAIGLERNQSSYTALHSLTAILGLAIRQASSFRKAKQISEPPDWLTHFEPLTKDSRMDQTLEKTIQLLLESCKSSNLPSE